MPTYEYCCEKCDHEFELFQSIKADALEICPKEVCPKKRWAKGKVRRAIGTGAGIIFKGSGFYETDYRSENYKAGAKKESETKKKTDSSSNSDNKSKGDSKSKPAKTGGKSASKK
ncbi:MAG TPA: FmdB family zinc ribbon protein [Verrucomicrobiota bacterium]|mgnify:CR=1 FL=1|jgi:putative FmdB family regulatory protein|nr:FmdB family zinc ribbon protein [Verrucomicrobiota bacterium]